MHGFSVFLAYLGMGLWVHVFSWVNFKFLALGRTSNIAPGTKNGLFCATLQVSLCAPKIVHAWFLCISGIFGYRSMGCLHETGHKPWFCNLFDFKYTLTLSLFIFTVPL